MRADHIGEGEYQESIQDPPTPEPTSDAEKAIAKVESFHRFLGSKAKEKKSREMYDALGFVILLAKAQVGRS